MLKLSSKKTLPHGNNTFGPYNIPKPLQLLMNYYNILQSPTNSIVMELICNFLRKLYIYMNAEQMSNKQLLLHASNFHEQYIQVKVKLSLVKPKLCSLKYVITNSSPYANNVKGKKNTTKVRIVSPLTCVFSLHAICRSRSYTHIVSLRKLHLWTNKTDDH